jgi:rfaE bifunctional protein kinase chain/domain
VTAVAPGVAAYVSDSQRLRKIIHRFPRVNALVIGDPMLDVYYFGRVERMSQEAPVPVFIEENKEVRPGGAANVAENLRALGCQDRVVFPETTSISRKFRYVVGHQQLLRIDEDHTCEPSAADIARAVQAAESADVIVLSDYAKGWLTSELCQAVIATGKPVVVDPKGGDWDKYAGCTVICPNDQELNAYLNYPAPTRALWQKMIHKRGKLGLEILDGPHRPPEVIPAQARHVFDVVGAGDTVTAVVAAAIGADAELGDAARLANYAAGYVVGIVGTAVCPVQKLLELV